MSCLAASCNNNNCCECDGRSVSLMRIFLSRRCPLNVMRLLQVVKPLISKCARETWDTQSSSSQSSRTRKQWKANEQRLRPRSKEKARITSQKIPLTFFYVHMSRSHETAEWPRAKVAITSAGSNGYYLSDTLSNDITFSYDNNNKSHRIRKLLS